MLIRIVIIAEVFFSIAAFASDNSSYLFKNGTCLQNGVKPVSIDYCVNLDISISEVAEAVLSGAMNATLASPANSDCVTSFTPQGLMSIQSAEASLTLTASPGGSIIGCSASPTFQSGDVVVREFKSPVAKVYNSEETISYVGPVGRTISINGIHIVKNLGSKKVWDFTISTNFQNYSSPLIVGAGNNPTGSIFVRDNINKVTTQSVFAGVFYSSECGKPVSGSITTVAVDGSYETKALVFTASCGLGILNGQPIKLHYSF